MQPPMKSRVPSRDRRQALKYPWTTGMMPPSSKGTLSSTGRGGCGICAQLQVKSRVPRDAGDRLPRIRGEASHSNIQCLSLKCHQQHGGWRWQPLISQVPAGKSKAIPPLHGGLQLSKITKIRRPRGASG